MNDKNRRNQTLTPTQEKTIAELLAGSSVTDAAERAGVARSTLHAWLAGDFNFQAELNRARAEMREVHQQRLALLGEQCVAVISEAVKAGDVKVALRVAEALGLLAVQAIGPTDPHALEVDAKEAAQREIWRELGWLPGTQNSPSEARSPTGQGFGHGSER